MVGALDLPYSIKFVADIDLDDYAEISGSKVLMLIGHSEYWTRTAREHFDEFVLGGGNATHSRGQHHVVAGPLQR